MNQKTVKKAWFLRPPAGLYDDYNGEIIHGETLSKAKAAHLREHELEWKELFQYTAKRRPDMDLVENVPHEKLPLVSQKQIQLMGHAIGHKYNDPDPYRNYFAGTVDGEPEWEDLVEKGMARRGSGPRPGFDYQCYHVTELGKAVIGSLHPVPRWAFEAGQKLPF